MTLTLNPDQTNGMIPAPQEPSLGNVSPQSLDKSKSMSKKDSEKLLTYAKKMLEKCVNPRITFEQQWYLNMCFYFGKHYVDWTPGPTGTLTRLYEPAAPPWRVRMIINQCRRIIRTELTKVTRQVPQWYVIPNTTDEEDRMAARAAEQISDYELRELKYNRIVRSASHWMTVCGTAFIKIYYDTNQIDPSGVQGKICMNAITPFHVYVPDLQEEDIEAQPFVIHTMLMDEGRAKDIYGIEVEANAEVRGAALEQRFFSAMGIKTGPSKDKVQVFEMWIKPCGKFPQGAMVTWSGTDLLYHQDVWPCPFEYYPIAKIDHIPTGRFYGDSALVDLIPVQKEVNRAHSQLIEIRNLMGKPQWKAAKGSIDPNKMTSQPGLIITYTPGFPPPERDQPPSLPSYEENELERLTRTMDDLAATGEITKGNVPPGVTAASAISYLQEENDNRFAPTVASIEEATEKMGKALLAFVNEYWDVERKVKVVGDNNLQEVLLFSKSDVKDNTDFTVEPGSAAPRSRAARQAFILELRKMGSIDDTKMLKYLDMVETDELYSDYQVDQRQIQRENVTMMSTPEPDPQQQMMQQQQPPQIDPATGQPVPPPLPGALPINPFDNDAAHIDGHGNYMKTEKYENGSPLQKQVMLQHYQDHINRQQQVQMQAQQQQLAQQPMAAPVSQRPSPQQIGT